jgi:putative membrane protein
MNVILLFLVGIIAAATMVIPGVSGSMMLMLLGYYEPILHLINQFVSGLIHFDMGKLLPACGALIPCGLGIVVGIFAVAKLIEWVMDRWPAQTYWAIIGLIVASPVAILLNTDWAGFSWIQLLIGVVTFGLGWFAASKLGGD